MDFTWKMPSGAAIEPFPAPFVVHMALGASTDRAEGTDSAV